MFKKKLLFSVCAIWMMLAPTSAFSQTEKGGFKLTANISICIDPKEPMSVQLAVKDLASDLEKVFGKRPAIIQIRKSIVNTIYVKTDAVSLPQAETFKIELARAENRINGIKISGADARGTIYGIYELAEKILGIDPQYFWTDHQPLKKTSISLNPNFNIVSKPPSFTYRGFFINDEDLLTGWAPDLTGKSGISIAVWDRVFETILRLKGNIVTPGTHIFPNEPQIKRLAERGLILSQHHVQTLGLNVQRWPKEKTYSFTTHPEILISAWEETVKSFGGQEILWTVGYRGLNDKPFWADDPNAPTSDSARASTIAAAIKAQMELVKKYHSNAKFILNSWNEAGEFIKAGLLNVPQEVTVLWSDYPGRGVLQDSGMAKKGQGAYYHTAMFSRVANQLTEGVPIERIEKELGRFARAGATSYLIINTSDIRPVPMSTKAAMNLAWDASAWADTNINETANFYKRWSSYHFGEKAAKTVVDIYRSYAIAPARINDKEGNLFGDNAYYLMCRNLLVWALKNDLNQPITQRNDATTRIFGLISKKEYANQLSSLMSTSQPGWNKLLLKADKLYPQIPVNARPFYQSHILTQITVHCMGNKALFNLANTIDYLTKSDQTSARLELDYAIVALKSVIASQEKSEYGKWKNFYKNGDWFVDVRYTLALAEALKSKLSGLPLPKDLPIDVYPVYPFDRVTRYSEKQINSHSK